MIKILRKQGMKLDLRKKMICLTYLIIAALSSENCSIKHRSMENRLMNLIKLLEVRMWSSLLAIVFSHNDPKPLQLNKLTSVSYIEYKNLLRHLRT